MLSSRKEEMGFRTQGEILLLDENRSCFHLCELFIHREGRLSEHVNTQCGRKNKESFEYLFSCFTFITV